MSETTAARRPARRRAGWIVAGAVAFTAVAAPAAGYARHVIDHGQSVEVDGTDLRVVYRGTVYTQEQLDGLQAEGKARFVAVDVASAREGVQHAFDTEAEMDAWGRANVLDRKRR